MGLFDWLQDEDNDGTIMDDGMKAGADALGAAYVAGGALMAGASALAPPATPYLLLGGGLMAAEGELISSDTGRAIAEEHGDFMADLMGIRGAPPSSDQPTTDPHYATGRTDGYGQRLNRGIRGLLQRFDDSSGGSPLPRLGNPTPQIPGLTD